jgi:radical SAM superfamily enzyme YgiQ (UPF0313 family)
MKLLNALATDNEIELIVFEKHLGFETAFSGTHLSKLESGIGEMNTMVAIAYLLNRFNENLNVGRSITKAQSAQIAADIIEKYPYETIEDIVLMLKYVRQGIIGDGKDFKVDGQNIMAKWMPEYLDKKYFEVEKMNQRQSVEKSTEQESDNHPVTLYYKRIREIKYKKQQLEKAKPMIDDLVKNMDRQMLEDTIADWEKKEEMKPYLDYLKSKRKYIKK